MIACPFCGLARRDLFTLSLHLDDLHAGRDRELMVTLAPRPLPVVEVDIDAVHRSLGRAAVQGA